MPTVKEVLNDTKKRLKEQGIDTYSLDSSLLVSEVTGLTKIQLVTHDRDEVTEQINRLENLVKERLKNKPMQYILGHCEFMGLDFKVTADGYEYLNPAGKLVKFENPKVSTLFLDDAMSNRGHIWNKTIPLLGKHAFMGSGANTYMFEVSQEDYISQNYVYGANSYDVKAHCWYLQQWVETGLLGTLALLVFLFWYLVQSVRIYRRVDLHESISWVGIWIFAGSAGVVYCRCRANAQCMYRSGLWGMLAPGTCGEPDACRERKSLCC